MPRTLIMVRVSASIVALVAATAPPCAAWEFRCRFVDGAGSVATPLANDTIDASDLQPHRIRLQFGVFDNDDGPAPAGGFIAWQGSITVSGTPQNSRERRTPGLLNPF